MPCSASTAIRPQERAPPQCPRSLLFPPAARPLSDHSLRRGYPPKNLPPSLPCRKERRVWLTHQPPHHNVPRPFQVRTPQWERRQRALVDTPQHIHAMPSTRPRDNPSADRPYTPRVPLVGSARPGFDRFTPEFIGGEPARIHVEGGAFWVVAGPVGKSDCVL